LQEAEIWRITVPRPVQAKKQGVMVTPVIPVMARRTNRRIKVHVDLGKKRDLLSKMTRIKRAMDMAQVVKHLPSKCKTLSSNPSTAKKKKANKIITIYSQDPSKKTEETQIISGH
jgi:hypothetical protein